MTNESATGSDLEMVDAKPSTRSSLPSKRSPPSSAQGSEDGEKHPAKKQAAGNISSMVDDDSGLEDYTRPPRVSFGVELEFLISTIPDDRWGPEDQSLRESIAAQLRENGIAAKSVLATDGEYPKDGSDPGNALWTVKGDDSVGEPGDDEDDPMYIWEPIEVASPAMYACDEMFKLVSTVVRLITAKFQVRVNDTCGLHVHVGNGRHCMDFDGLRNYAALLWAAEPALSTLDCPSRGCCQFAKSNRRFQHAPLSRGSTAADALRAAQGERSWAARYHGRGRKLGEPPVGSRQAYRHLVQGMASQKDIHNLAQEPESNSDVSDWEAEASRPFYRPRKARTTTSRRVSVPELEHLRFADIERQLDNETTARQRPPQIQFPKLVQDEEDEDSAQVRTPFLGPGRAPRRKQIRMEDIIRSDGVVARYQPSYYAPHLPAAKQRGLQDALPECKLTWPGVAELLACDVGAHQLAWLVGEDRVFGSNWSGVGKASLDPRHPLEAKYHTVESRAAGGSLDAEWVATWARIQCRMLEWARDAEPSALMEVIGNLARDDHDYHNSTCTYDVLDLLRDLGLYTEVRLCEDRLRRAEEAWFQCMLLRPYEESSSGDVTEDQSMDDASTPAAD
ncbi:hypothetical protein ACJ41O_002797 [Fusarium nematophilum]